MLFWCFIGWSASNISQMIWWAAMLDFFVSLPKEPAITISKHRIQSLKTIPEPFLKVSKKMYIMEIWISKVSRPKKWTLLRSTLLAPIQKKWSKVPCPSPRRERLPLLAPGRPHGCISVVPKTEVPQNGWFIMENPIKWMIWGYPYFWKRPSTCIYTCIFFGSTLDPGFKLQIKV